MIQKQGKASRGSQYWLQKLINKKQKLLNERILYHIEFSQDTKIEWVSPLSYDGYKEYQDNAFLEKLGLKDDRYHSKLKEFWPKGGPVWDALGKSDDPEIFFLVEAKANIPEFHSIFPDSTYSFALS